MSKQVDLALMDLDTAMVALKKSMAHVPVRRAGFKRLHDTLAKTAASLAVEMRYAKPRMRG